MKSQSVPCVKYTLRTMVVLSVVGFGLAAALRDLRDSVITDTQAMIYLSQYGYLSPSVRDPSKSQYMSEDSVSKAIMEFQAFAGVNTTGTLNTETLELMVLPRCGVKDKVGSAAGTGSRSRRYALQGSRWRVRDLTYRVAKYPHRLTRSEVDGVIREAFDVWARHTDLTFTRKSSNPVHIEIRFEEGEHGDGDPFDGPGGTLAHAYFPVYGGDAHFDDAETWTIDSRRGTNLLQVAAHEFGHSLGLSHSDVRGALMAPFYRGFVEDFDLHSDDIKGIQSLYGSRSDSKDAGSDNTHTVTSHPASKLLCDEGAPDTMFSSAGGANYVFKGPYYWRLSDDSVQPGYPKLINESWHGLPGNINAAFTHKNGKTYFFRGSYYWRYTDKTKDPGYPKAIKEGFAGIPDNVDAALVWGGNGKIYFFKDSKFWKFNPAERPPVKSTYPKPISNWQGIPDNLDAAFLDSNGYTYFFKGKDYYRFNDKMFAVDRASPPFPRSAGEWWFGCGSAKKGNLVLAPLRSQDVPGAFDSADGSHADLRDSSREELSSEKGLEITNIEMDHSGSGSGSVHDRNCSRHGLRSGCDKQQVSAYTQPKPKDSGSRTPRQELVYVIVCAALAAVRW